MKNVIVLPYDPAWADAFIQIKEELLTVLAGHVDAIEHVGSTSVPGLAAKPIIDIDVVIRDYNSFEWIKNALAELEYEHEGDLGIKDRHAFRYKSKPHLMQHHLYVCPAYSNELRRHLAFRDYLLVNPRERDTYNEVKQLAAKHYAEDRGSYMIAKHPFCMEILEKCGFTHD